MLLQREKKILTLLLKHRNGKELTIAQIASELQVSTRTIKTDVRNINEVLEMQSCSIQTKRGVGIWLNCDSCGEAYLKSVLSENRESDIASEERKYYIASEVLNSGGYISMESLANRFFVSKATVLNDLNKMESFWEKNEIAYTKKVKYGVKAEGSERKIRRVLFRLQKKIIESSLGNAVDKLQILYPDISLLRLEKIIMESEKKFDFVFTDISFDEFLIQVGIIVQRVKRGHLIVDSSSPVAYGQERREWVIGQFLREQIAMKENCMLPEPEMQEVLKKFKRLRYQVPVSVDIVRDDLDTESFSLYQYMQEVLKEADAKYLLHLAEDEELMCSLFKHLEAMIHRIQGETYLKNPVLESVKNEMSYEYEIASYIISKFRENYKIDTTDDEIGYVAFWVGTYLERLAQQRQKTHAVTIVCMTGLGTSQFISVKLKRLFPNIVVKQIVSENMALELKREEQDFVITTVPLTIEGVDVVQVSVVLNEQDAKCIQQQINKIDKKQDEQHDIYTCLKEFWDESISILQCDLKSREEAILLLGNRMIREGYADEGYVESVLEREKISDTYMSSMIAIPHSFSGHILKQGIGILTLKKPILWGEGQTRIVLMLALDAKTENEKFQKIFKAIYHLTRNIKDIDKILKAEDFEVLKRSLL